MAVETNGGEGLLDYTDRDLGELMVKRGLLSPHQLNVIVQKYQKLKGTPQEKSFDTVLLESGLIKDEFLENLRIQTRVWSRCTQCAKLFQIHYYNPAFNYVCKGCGGKLEQTQVTEATIVVGGPSPDSSAFEKTTVKSSHSGISTTSATQSGTRQPKRVPAEVEAALKDPKRTFGKYILTKELGRGGTAVVYKAWDNLLHQFVAVKIIKLHDAEESESSEPSNEIRDFQKEARMSARLRHPNIIRIFELGSIDDKHYLAMELMEGPTFFEFIHGSRQRNLLSRFHDNPEKFLQLMRDVARAVHYAHTLNPPVIHRDLKPQNVLLDTNLTPYVADFGLAKEVEMGHTVTMTGVVKGTPSYMSPEQAEGHSKETDTRTDVYSMGAILYEVLTGRPPFVGDNVRQVLNQIVTKIPERPNEVIAKLAQTDPTAPHWTKPVAKELETICLKALEKKPADRYATAQSFADDIDRFLQNLEIEAREPGVIRKGIRKLKAHPILTLAAASILFASLAAGAVVKFGPKPKGSLDEIVAIASEHHKNRDYSALRTDVDNLRKLDPQNPRIAEFEASLKEHEADLERRRAEWDTALKRLKTESIKAVVESLRAPYAGAAEIKDELKDKLERALLEVQGSLLNEIRELVGPGPNPGWLDEKIKSGAKASRDRATELCALTGDGDFPFAVDAAMAGSLSSLDRILGYQGIWQLRVNVAPFAEVVLLLDGKEVAREFTPLGLRSLEVASGYKLELRWPSSKEPKHQAVKDLKDLRHGAVVVVTGDVTKSDIRVIQKSGAE